MNQTICPTGFVIPEHPDDHRVQYVDLTITECAFSCVSHPRYTPEEYAWVFIVRVWCQAQFGRTTHMTGSTNTHT